MQKDTLRVPQPKVRFWTPLLSLIGLALTMGVAFFDCRRSDKNSTDTSRNILIVVHISKYSCEVDVTIRLDIVDALQLRACLDKLLDRLPRIVPVNRSTATCGNALDWFLTLLCT